MLWKYTLLWLGMPILAIINGTIRNLFYKDALGELFAHQLSTASLMVLIGAYTWLFGFLWRIQSTNQALIIGLIWVSLTIAFEFLFGHYIIGHPWARLLHDYNILQGRVWLLVLIWTALAPFTFYKLQY
jgi:hypothetical protein